MLPIAPATYYDHLAKRADPARLSDHAKRDEALRPEIQRVFDANWQVYGVRKIRRQLRREGFDVARCTVARLMKVTGIQGIIRGKPHKTTVPDDKLPCPLDKVSRQFCVPAPTCRGGSRCPSLVRGQWPAISTMSPYGRGLCRLRHRRLSADRGTALPTQLPTMGKAWSMTDCRTKG